MQFKALLIASLPLFALAEPITTTTCTSTTTIYKTVTLSRVQITTPVITPTPTPTPCNTPTTIYVPPNQSEVPPPPPGTTVSVVQPTHKPANDAGMVKIGSGFVVAIAGAAAVMLL